MQSITRFHDGYKKKRYSYSIFGSIMLHSKIWKTVGQSALFFQISILSLGLKNKCCTFRAAILFCTRRCICTTLKTRRFRSLSKRQTIEPQKGGEKRRKYGRWCIRECIVPPILFTVKNKLPTARTGRAVYFFLLSHFLSARAAALVYGA